MIDITFNHYTSYNKDDICSSLNAYLIEEYPHELRNGKIFYTNKYIILCSLYVDKSYRNDGIGSLLLNQLIEFAKNQRITQIMLDDMTDRYRKQHNIYLKHGFKYINEFGPEMIKYI